jgi:histidinol-phosphate phosphatase family protein
VSLIAGAADAIRRLNRRGLLTVVVTNQAVIARGELSFEGLERVHARFDQLLGLHGAYVDRVYTCPHHPDRGFPGEIADLKIVCECRKPGTALIDNAVRDLSINRKTSWMVGDATSDIEAGRRAGLRTVLVRTGHAGDDGRCPFYPDYVVPDLGAAVAWILDGYPAVRDRLASVLPACAGARLVLIGGLARTGKSSVAQVLKEMLAENGRGAHVLPLDSWLKAESSRAEGTSVAERFDIDAASQMIRRLVDAPHPQEVELPVYDRRNRRPFTTRVRFCVAPADVLIVEGVPALMLEELMPAAAVRIHLDMPEPARLDRLRADYQWRGESPAAVDALIASRAADETPLVQAASSRANVTIEAWTGQ